MNNKINKDNIGWQVWLVLALLFFILIFVGYRWSAGNSIQYNYLAKVNTTSSSLALVNIIATSTEKIKPTITVSHIKTPDKVRAVYMSSWVAGTPSFRDRLVSKIEGTEINAVVIDIKDYSGKIVVKLDDHKLVKIASFEKRVPDILEFIDLLHQKNIYVIGRISVFQDNHLARHRPDLAVRRVDNGGVWEDDKKIAWLDPGAKEVWDYTVDIAKASYQIGFDEINFDYIRFPSDGSIRNMKFLHYDSNVKNKADAMEEFFIYLNRKMTEAKIPTSADIFGMVTINSDDLNIGQVLEKIAPHFDYIAPMVYPSHYPSGFLNYSKPATKPYEVIKHCLDIASARLTAIGEPVSKIRPWLQDFDLGATYTAEMIKLEKQATYDAGLDSWMMWDPSNVYTNSAWEKI